MGWTETLGALRRRWYLAVAGLAATAGLAFVAWQVAPPTFQASGTVLLLPPSYDLVDGQNPYLELGNLDMPASIVSAYLDGDVARERIAAGAPTADYSVGLDPSVRGPIILVTVEDQTSEGVVRVLGEVLDTIPAALVDLQTQLAVPPDATITSMPLAVDTDAEPVTRATMRAVVAAAGLGVLLTVAGTVGLDAWLRRRSALRIAARVIAAAEAVRDLRAPPDAADPQPTDDGKGKGRGNGRGSGRAPARVPAP